MKKLLLSIAMITFIAGTVSVSFGQNANNQSDMGLKKVVVQVDTVNGLENLTKASEIRFTENEKSITDLKLKNTTTDTLKKSAKNKEIDLLLQKNNSLRKDLVSYKKEGKTEWNAFQKQFNTDMDKLTEDLNNMKDPEIK